jgi:hypothetical protein
MNGGDDLVVTGFPYTEPQLGHHVAVLQLDYGLVCHFSSFRCASPEGSPAMGCALSLDEMSKNESREDKNA